jgi:hypothetical protein
MPFTIEGETSSGEYFVVEGIDTFDDVREWLEFLEEEYDVVDAEWEYEG